MMNPLLKSDGVEIDCLIVQRDTKLTRKSIMNARRLTMAYRMPNHCAAAYCFFEIKNIFHRCVNSFKLLKNAIH